MTSTQQLQQFASENPEKFWGVVADKLHWKSPYDKVLNDSKKPLYSWFIGGEFNICDNAVDRDIEEGRGEKTAIIVDSSITGRKISYTYNQLLDEVSRLAGLLKKHGVEKGDRVVIYMPMLVQTAFEMLACARLGAIGCDWVRFIRWFLVVFGIFSAKEIAKRIDDAKPKLILSASCGVEPKGIIEYVPIKWCACTRKFSRIRSRYGGI